MSYIEFTGALDSGPPAGTFVPFSGELDAPAKPSDPLTRVTPSTPATGAATLTVTPRKPDSVLENQPAEFNPQAADALSNRSVAEATPAPGDPRSSAPLASKPGRAGFTPQPGPRSGLDVAGDVGAATLKIGPTALKTLAQVYSMGTGGALGPGAARQMDQGMAAIDKLFGSKATQYERMELASVLRDQAAGGGDLASYLVKHPMLMADMGITTVGSMFVPMGAVGAASKLAKAPLSARAATEIANTVNAAMNGADTFDDTQGDLGQKYVAAALAALGSYGVGRATGAGLEGQMARRVVGQRVGGAPLTVAKEIGKESIQEYGENVSQSAGQDIGEGRVPDPLKAHKEGVLGAAIAPIAAGPLTVANARAPVAPAPLPSAEDMVRQRFGARQDPVSTILAAPDVDSAISAATAALAPGASPAETAVDNIARILGQQPGVAPPPPPPAPPAPPPQATDAVAAGMPPFTVTLSPTGNLTAIGDPQALTKLLKAAGITSFLQAKNGLVVGKSQAEAAQQALADFPAPPAQVARPSMAATESAAGYDVAGEPKNASVPDAANHPYNAPAPLAAARADSAGRSAGNDAGASAGRPASDVAAGSGGRMDERDGSIANPSGTDAATPNRAVAVAFTTAKGSTYQLHEDGTTTRNKAARQDPGHEGDAGLKARTARTVYVDTDAAALSAAGLQNAGERGARVVLRDGKATLLTWNEAKNRWGAAPSARDVPAHDQPAVGRFPLEMWNPKQDVPGHTAYGNMHAGNKIISLQQATAPAAAAAAAPAASTTAPVAAPAEQRASAPAVATAAAKAPETREEPLSALRRAAATLHPALPEGEVGKIVADLTRRWKNPPGIKIVVSSRDLPVKAPEGTRGYYDGTTAYIVASQQSSRDDVGRTLAHEAIAHHGLENILSEKQWFNFQRALSLGVKAGNPGLRAAAAYVDSTYRGKLNDDRDRTHEIAARVIEEAVDPKTGEFRPGYSFLKSVWANVADWLRGMGVRVKFTTAELHGMLVNAQRSLEVGKKLSGRGKALVGSAKDGHFQMAWHGTPHEVDKFKSDAIGTGEGAQAYGHGLYFAGKKDVAEFYRKKLSGDGYGIVKINGADQTQDPDFGNMMVLEVDDRPRSTLRGKAGYDYMRKVLQPWLQNKNRPGQEARLALEWLGEAEAKGKSIEVPGRDQKGKLYQVDLPEDGEYLLWDKPLSAQPEKVKAALAEAEVTNRSGQDMLQMDPTGEEIIKALGKGEGASTYLRSLGIRGVKYLDGASRNRPLREIKREFLSQLPQDADFNEVMDLIGQGTFSPANEAILKELAANDWLGFDYPAQALSAALSNGLSNFDASPELLKAVADAQVDATFNYVIFDDADVKITGRFALGKNQQPTSAAQMSWEATPGRSTGVLPGIFGAATAQKFEYLRAIQKVLTGRKGGDLIARKIGLPAGRTFLGLSAWEGEIGAGAQTLFSLLTTGKGSKRDVTPKGRQLMNLYAAIKGQVLNQEAVVWHIPINDGVKENENGYEAVFNRALAESEMQQLYQALHERFGTWEIAPGYTEAGFRALNFAIDNKEFQRGIIEVLELLPEDFSGGHVSGRAYRSVGDYISNDWNEAPHGEQYARQIEGAADRLRGPGRSDLQTWTAGLRARVAAVNEDFARRYGWDKARPAAENEAGLSNDQASHGLFALTGRGKTPSVATDKTVAGTNQGGRPAGDSTTGSARFTEDNRLSNLSWTGASWTRIREQNPALAAAASVDDEVTIYRATIGDAIRPDDFVAVDKRVAHAELKNVRARDGSGKVISQKVRVRDLLMGNDATEFVYFPANEPSASAGSDAKGLFALTGTGNTTVAAPPASPTSPWRDVTGRLQFVPGAWLYDKLGAAAGPLLSKLQLKAPSPTLRRALREMKLDVSKAQETAGAVAGEAMKLSEAEREMVSGIIEQELAAGTVPPQHAVRLAAMINATMGAQTDELVRLGMLTQDSADRWRDKYLPRFYVSKLHKQVADAWADAVNRLFGRQRVMTGMKGKHLRGRGLYESVPVGEIASWEAQGWEVRDPEYEDYLANPGAYQTSWTAANRDVQMWRDFSRQERDSMGEIRDAGFRFVMGYMQTQRDIALGRLFETLANDAAMSGRSETNEFSVHVPDGTIPDTGAKRYGRLAGRWVSKDTMSHLSHIEEAQSDAWRMYRKALSIWKEGKTSLNPVSHVNNMVSNITMAHLAGVGYWDGHKYIAAAHDFATGAAGVKEAKDAGLFLGTMSDAELMNVLPADLKALVRQQDSTTTKIGRTAFNVMTFYLRRPMGWAYQAEDTFFRYVIYRDARKRGVEPADAVDYAQKFIFSYDDLPKGARMIRDIGIPFFSYTYKAVPALLHTALTHPLRMAAPAAVLWGANAAAYAIASGDDDDSWEERLRKYLTDPEHRERARKKEQLEREHLPPWMKGSTSLGSPKAIRLGMDEVTKLPVFIDVSRIVPGGDLFDMHPNAGGIPWLQPITPSNPLLTTYMAMFGNRDSFFGKDIVDSNDTTAEATEKRLTWIWQQFSPAIAAGNYHWERGMNALAQASGGEVKWLPEVLKERYTGIGRDGNPVQPGYAAMQTFGIKARPIDLEMAETIERHQRDKLVRDIDAEINKLQRLNNKGAVSDSVMEKERTAAREKKDRLRQGLTVDGNAKD